MISFRIWCKRWIKCRGVLSQGSRANSMGNADYCRCLVNITPVNVDTGLGTAKFTGQHPLPDYGSQPFLVLPQLRPQWRHRFALAAVVGSCSRSRQLPAPPHLKRSRLAVSGPFFPVPEITLPALHASSLFWYALISVCPTGTGRSHGRCHGLQMVAL